MSPDFFWLVLSPLCSAKASSVRSSQLLRRGTTACSFLFRKKRHVKRKKAISLDIYPPPSIFEYIHAYILRILILDSFGLSSCIVLSHSTTPHAMCVCMCVSCDTHTNTHTLQLLVEMDLTLGIWEIGPGRENYYELQEYKATATYKVCRFIEQFVLMLWTSLEVPLPFSPAPPGLHRGAAAAEHVLYNGREGGAVLPRQVYMWHFNAS